MLGDDLTKFRYTIEHSNVSGLTPEAKQRMLDIIQTMTREVEAEARFAR